MRPLLLAVLLLTTTGLAQPTLPETPAGQALAAWLAAFNTGDASAVKSFDERYRPPTPLAQISGNMRQPTGGFALVRVETSEPRLIIALLQEKNSDQIARIEFEMTTEEPVRIARQALRAVPRPADLALVRMSEAAALSALAARVDERVKSDDFSGVVLVARHGKILLHKAAGQANRQLGTPITLETKFRNGSMNKMFTSVATLQLVEAGKLSLSDPIGKHLTGYPNAELASKVTVRHLLTHTGGTGDIFGPEFAKHRATLREHADYVKLYGERELGFEPGTQWRYSNYGFVLLGALIEKISGESYYDYVRRHIFQPAGMTSTDSLPESEAVPHRSVGYMRRGTGWMANTETLPWRGTAAGGGYSTPGDFLRFAQALESGKLISKKLLAEATTSQHPQQPYGYGFGLQRDGQPRSYGHGGGAPGMNGEFRVYPELGYVLVALSNLDPPAATSLVDFFAARMPIK
jgi:D-alanyl-D-alanine carboxypeptidase